MQIDKILYIGKYIWYHCGFNSALLIIYSYRTKLQNCEVLAILQDYHFLCIMYRCKSWQNLTLMKLNQLTILCSMGVGTAWFKMRLSLLLTTFFMITVVDCILTRVSIKNKDSLGAISFSKYSLNWAIYVMNTRILVLAGASNSTIYRDFPAQYNLHCIFPFED